ncbi:hypothetical protein HaLaN_08381 [Haematococcus lacustris]|uniref:Uncharacterized protein n=1 Tax=Haematococcus lacustris TaxID=44745 RepID=A0A699Z0W6_HAELA|nr:hypothetical protein HaLaN_08381 [Haematococcus lacustris]
MLPDVELTCKDGTWRSLGAKGIFLVGQATVVMFIAIQVIAAGLYGPGCVAYSGCIAARCLLPVGALLQLGCC